MPDAVPARAPEIAADRLLETRRHRLARGGIGGLEKRINAFIAEGRIEQDIELAVEAGGQRGGEGEEALDAPRHLRRAAIAVPHHAFDPGWIGGAAAHDAGDLLEESAHARAIGAGNV